MAQKMIQFEILSFVTHVHLVFFFLHETLTHLRTHPSDIDINLSDEITARLFLLKSHRDDLQRKLSALPPKGIPILIHYLNCLKL
jgi:hypothetical protein